MKSLYGINLNTGEQVNNSTPLTSDGSLKMIYQDKFAIIEVFLDQGSGWKSIGQISVYKDPELPISKVTINTDGASARIDNFQVTWGTNIINPRKNAVGGGWELYQ